jgi:hypothetical protein
LIVAFSFAQYSTQGAGPPRGKRMDVKKANSVPNAIAAQILANETEVWEAAKRKDMRKFDALVGDDAWLIFTSGIQTKAQYIKSIAERNITNYSLKNFEMLMPAQDVVIVTYIATISGIFGGKASTQFSVREGSVWVKRNKKWVAVVNQETPISKE